MFPEHCYKKYPERENVKRLKNGYDPKEIYKKTGGSIKMPTEYSDGTWKLI